MFTLDLLTLDLFSRLFHYLSFVIINPCEPHSRRCTARAQIELNFCSSRSLRSPLKCESTSFCVKKWKTGRKQVEGRRDFAAKKESTKLEQGLKSSKVQKKREEFLLEK